MSFVTRKAQLDMEDTPMRNPATSMERERQAIAEAASEITNLWWTNPVENGHVKAQIVRDIIQKHLWSFTDAEVKRA